MNVQNTEAWKVFRETSEQGVSAVPASLGVNPTYTTTSQKRRQPHVMLCNIFGSVIPPHRT